MNFINQYLWQLIAGVELLIIVAFLLRMINKKRKLSPEEVRLRKAKKNEVDMKGLMKDLHLSKDLYKELSRSCHPDRFVGTGLVEKANELFQLIQKNKNNYEQLMHLKGRMSEELKTL